MQHNTKCCQFCFRVPDNESWATCSNPNCQCHLHYSAYTTPPTENKWPEKWPDSAPTEKGCCPRCEGHLPDKPQTNLCPNCPCHHPTKESGEWRADSKPVEFDGVKWESSAFWQRQLKIEYIHAAWLVNTIRTLLANTEKQAREEDIEEAFEKSAWGKAKAEMLLEEGRQRGADEMLERMIAMVPEEHYSLLGVQIGRVYNEEDKTWNACREAILASLRSLKSKE